MDTEDSLGEFEAHKKQSMQNLIASTTKSRTGFSYSGFLPHNSTMQIRDPRSFSKERFAQLLRQIATQLYHFCCSQELKPIEVQIMYLNGSLFISANTKESVVAMSALLSDKDAFREALTTAYSYEGSEPVDRKISARHAAKLASRLYGDYNFEDPRFVAVKTILNGEATMIPVVLPNLSNINGAGNIYFVSDKLKADRHAEENLLDVMVAFTLEVVDAKSKPAIFGKKRPCFNCHARLEAVSRKMQDDFSMKTTPFDFNPNKGLLFKGAAERQLKNEDSAEASAASLGKYSHIIYTSKEGDSSYATASDTETEVLDEEEELRSKPMEKLSLGS